MITSKQNLPRCITLKKKLGDINKSYFHQQLLAFAALVAVALAAPLDDSKNAQILKYESDNIGIGGYSFA